MSYPGDLIRDIQELARFGITQWDLTTGEVAWSDEQFRIHGWEPGAVTPGLEVLLQRVEPADVGRVRQGFERARRGHTASAIEYRIVRSDGALCTLQARTRVLVDERGAPYHMLTTTTDITEHEETAARIVLTDRMASVGTLAAGVAHEINNPLAFISAHLELITEELGEPLPGELGLMLGETRHGVERIRNIVRGLMAFARTDDDQHTPLDVERVLELAILMASNEIRHRARLVRSYNPLPTVMANQATLGQAFLNLLVNAAEAIPEGQTEHHQIEISTRADDAGWAIVEIRDTGRGIAREIQGRLFDPFFTTKPVGQGTGLGLSICHGIVRSIGGEVGFTSAPGQGAVFRVALPPAVAAPRAAQPSAPAALTPLPGRARTKVLIVDDEVVFATALRRLLSRDNHLITIVHDGKDALTRIAAGERFDAIVCDLMMPGMSGMELHAQLLAQVPEQAARMIFLTGGAFSASAKQFLADLPTPWFDKPCDLETLRTVTMRIALTPKIP